MSENKILDVTKANINLIKLDMIKNIVCKYYELEPQELIRRTRKSHIVIARKMCVLFIKKYIPKMTFEAIGSVFNQDHSNIVYAFNHASSLIEVDKELKEDYKIMHEQVQLKIETITDGNTLKDYYYFDLNNVKAVIIDKQQFILFKGIGNNDIEAIVKSNFPQLPDLSIISVTDSGCSILQKKVDN